MAASSDLHSIPFLPAPRQEAALQGGNRQDNRGFEEFRPAFMQTGVISQAAGSAYAELGRTKVMVAVYGPRSADRNVGFSELGRLQVDMKLAAFSTRTRGKIQQTPQEKEYSALLQTALESAVILEEFPKSTVDVYVCVLEAAGGELPAAVCAASLALADAGIAMRDLVAACSVNKVGGVLLLDPTDDEAYRQDASAMMAHMPLSNMVSQLVMTGEWKGSTTRDALSLCMGGCAQVDAVMRDALRLAAEQKS